MNINLTSVIIINQYNKHNIVTGMQQNKDKPQLTQQQPQSSQPSSQQAPQPDPQPQQPPLAQDPPAQIANQQPVMQSSSSAGQVQAQPAILLSLEETRTQLKNQQKENKVLQTKNKKLQTKYIELFKEQKALKKDWTVLTTIIKQIFPELQQKPVGKYDIEQLKQSWNFKQSKIKHQLEQSVDSFNKHKQKIQRQSSEYAEQRVNKVTRQCKDKIEALNKQLDSFKKNGKNLADQLADYDKKLQAKSEQVSKLTKDKLKLEHQLNQIKMKSITDELVDKSQQHDQKVNNERNQLLGLRQQIQHLMEKRDQLRTELKTAKAQVDKLKVAMEVKDKEIQELKQHRNNNKNGHLSNNSNNGNPDKKQKNELQQKSEQSSAINKNGNLQPILQSKISINSSSELASQQQSPLQHFHHLSQDDDYIHRQYMKNVFIRYMKSYASGDHTQAQVLLNIILTMLKFNNNQKQVLNSKKKNWWGIY